MTDMDFRPERLPEALDDATLAAHRPAVRALLVKRLEGLWSVADEELDAGKDRVRWAEFQLRVAKQLGEWYRLGVPAAAEEEETDAGSELERVRAMVTMQLDDLAGREGS